MLDENSDLLLHQHPGERKEDGSRSLETPVQDRPERKSGLENPISAVQLMEWALEAASPMEAGAHQKQAGHS
ncbi:MAG: hypothetical protein DBW84_00815 [Synechococcus sp. MED-G70]|nr:MAG: hypothetical protein DBW84_00815 [Synechococcus sp. MED-G70]